MTPNFNVKNFRKIKNHRFTINKKTFTMKNKN